jgi:ABC-type multidrug transport system ATPase subunit
MSEGLAIAAAGLCKRFGRGPSEYVTALDDVTFDVRQGSALGMSARTARARARSWTSSWA